MGIIEGSTIQVSNAHYGGPVVVQLQDAQYGIGIGVASKIDVTPIA
jgi:Fe2+ transport system protein FeoA